MSGTSNSKRNVLHLRSRGRDFAGGVNYPKKKRDDLISRDNANRFQWIPSLQLRYGRLSTLNDWVRKFHSDQLSGKFSMFYELGKELGRYGQYIFQPTDNLVGLTLSSRNVKRELLVCIMGKQSRGD